MRIFLTGATGAIGSMHLLDLVARRYDVICLVRGNSATDRLNRLAAIVGMEIASQVNIVNGDVTQPLAGIDELTISALKGQIDIIIHHAGSIKFDRKYQNEIMATNVGGTANMLALAEIWRVKKFCYDSTAYTLNIEPRNPYEESKQIAEAMVLDWHGGQPMVWRPGIVIGRQSDGKSQGFNGYYGFFNGFFSLKVVLKQKWETEGRESCLKQGFEFDESGLLILNQPLYVDYSRESTLNLVPVDWVVKSMTDLMETARWGMAYNIVDNFPQKFAWVIERSLAILGVQGVKRLPHHNVDLVPSVFLRGVQEKINSRLERFWPYINHEPRFVSDAPTSAPVVDQALLQIILGYAMKMNFGHQRK